MTPVELIRFLGVLERLKSNTRHSWTRAGTQETVAAHSWRLAVMALLLDGEIDGVDMRRVVEMCLVHDFGEAVTGDIPSFEKDEADEEAEAHAVDAMVTALPDPQRTRLASLFAEMNAMQSPEARVFKALDKMEAVLQHNEASLQTWLPLEYDLQRTYGTEEAEAFAWLEALRVQLRIDTEQKIEAGNEA